MGLGKTAAGPWVKFLKGGDFAIGFDKCFTTLGV